MEQPYGGAYEDEVVIPQEVENGELHTAKKGVLGGKFATDDMILIAVILLLLTDSKSDKATLLILAVLFLAGTDIFG